MFSRKILLTGVAIIFFFAADAQQSPVSAAAGTAAGSWRGELTVAPGIMVPINFVIESVTGGAPTLYFQNAEEKFEGGSVRRLGDSIFVPINQFDNELALKIGAGKLRGVLRKQDGSGTPTPLSAWLVKNGKNPGEHTRFNVPARKASGDLSGTYDIHFTSSNGSDEKAVGLFDQKGNHLRATFLRVSGDSRFLEGTVAGDTFYLSAFIGSSPAYYKGTFDKKGNLSGQVIGARGSSPFTGVLNDTASLPDAYGLTYLKEGYKTLDFTFPNVDGKPVSLKDAKYRDKVVVVTITGSWCPNCIDEASFLAPWYVKNRDRGVEIVSIHYERQTDSAYVRKVITRFRDRFKIQYDQVIAGVADKQTVATSLPALNTFLSFPTTIILDRSGNVAQIHTGYSGPATGKYYAEWVKEFNDEIDLLLKKPMGSTD